MFKYVGRTSLVLLQIFILIVLGGEIYARVTQGRLLNDRAKVAEYRNSDLTVHHKLIPNSTGRSTTKEWDVKYKVNSFGFRDKEYSKEKPDNVFRILVLGDSFTEGYGVEGEETFVKILEKELNEPKSGKMTYEVINCGVASYSPLLEYLFLKTKGLELDPDMVIIFYDFGDLEDDCEYTNLCEFDENGNPQRSFPYKRVRPIGTNPLERFLAKYSRYYLYLENKINKHVYKSRKLPNIFARHGFDVDRFMVFRPHNKKDVVKAWDLSSSYLDLIYEQLKERNIEFVLVSYPYAIEVGPYEWSEGRGSANFETGKVYPEPELVSMLDAFCGERDMPFINLYSYFRENASVPLYFSFDGHFNASGHKVAGQGAAKELKKIFADQGV
jgi:hypothetical protein